MSGAPKAPAPTTVCALIIEGLSNNGLKITGTGNLDTDLDLLLAAANSLHQQRKKQSKDKPLIEVPNMGSAAMSVMNGGRG